MRRLVAALLLGVAVLSASPARSAELLVSAAASLSDAFVELAALFEQEHPGVKVIGNFASSGALYRQIAQGAPVDVYASANWNWMAEAAGRGLVGGEKVRKFATNELVLAVPATARVAVGGLNDLGSPAVTRLALGSPETVPAGLYARNAMLAAGLWGELGHKLIFGESARQVLDYLRRGEVDAGFIYATDAVKGGAAARVVAVVPLAEPPAYFIAPLRNSRRSALAQSFVGLVTSERGEVILARHGLKPAI